MTRDTSRSRYPGWVVLMLATASFGARSVSAVDVVLQNDSATGETNGYIEAGFVAGEIGAAVFAPTAAQVQFPVKLKGIQILWASLSGTTGQTLGGAIHIYNGGMPNPTEVCVIANDCSLLGPVLTDSLTLLNEFVVDPDDPNHAEGITQPVILNGPKFTLGYEFDENPDTSNGPSLVVDSSGCQGAGFPNFSDVNSKNLLRTTGGQWQNICAYGVSGDLIIRARVEHINTSPPTVSSIMPNTGTNGGPINVTIMGANFISGTTVKLFRTDLPGMPQISATNINITSEAQLTCTFNLTGAATGSWNVVAMSGNGTGPACACVFNVTPAPPPMLSAFSPSGAQANCGVISCGVFGNNLQSGATVRAVSSGAPAPDIVGFNYSYPNANFVGFSLNIGGAVQGLYNIVLTNPNGDPDMLSNALNISSCQPAISSISPNSAPNSQPVNISDLHGGNFVDGPGTTDSTVQLTRSGQMPINGTSVVVVSSSQIMCTFDITARLPGFWNVVVSNPNGGTATFNSGFEIIAGPPPGVFAINPNTADSCGALMGAQIFGFNFYTTGVTSVRLTHDMQPDIPGINVQVANSNSMTADFDLTGAASGAWNVVVTNPDQQQGSLMNGFNVSACVSAVTIVSANPTGTNPYNPALPFRDVLQNTTTGLVAQGIGLAGTPAEGPYSYDTFSVTFSGVPSSLPSPGNIIVSCTGGICPTVTAVSGSGAGPYLISLSAAPPVLNCITFTFAGTSAGQRLQYQNLPGDVNLNGTTTGQDVLALVSAINAGDAGQSANLARFDTNRNGAVTGQDVLRLVQLLNGANATQAFNGAAVAVCP